MRRTSWLREFAGLGVSLLASLFGWIIIAPVAVVMPKRRDWIAVIGRQNGKFLDNAKYFFLQAETFATDLRIVYVTEYAEVVTLLRSSGRQALHYPNALALWYLLRCGSAVVDSTDWERHLRRFLLMRAHVVQLWHGVGFKRIETDKWRFETGRYRWLAQPWVFSLRMLFYRINGRMVRYAVVACTSAFYRDQVFVRAFRARHLLVAGYPRNTFAKGSADVPKVAWSNVDPALRQRIDEWVASGRRLVIVVPTLRDSKPSPLAISDVAAKYVDGFAESHNTEFVFKFHPSEQSVQHFTGRHLHTCSPDSDIYPLLPHTSALITDYSSIYMDYLLLDLPVLFLIPDGNSYVDEDREVQFRLADMMPGPKLATWAEVTVALLEQWQQDAFAVERARLRKLAFDDLPQAQAVPKILGFMRAQGWVE